jgi:hypothetical protein
VVGGVGKDGDFLISFESHMTYLAGSQVLRSWPEIRLTKKIFAVTFGIFNILLEVFLPIRRADW